MTFQLRVDGTRWRAHLQAYAEREPEVVPVVKGNGYGFGFERLLVEPAPRHWGELAVGTYAEAVTALGSTGAELVVLNPWRPDDPSAAAAMASSRLLHCLGRVADVAPFAVAAGRAGGARVAVEVLTSMRRHGVSLEDLPAMASAVRAAGPAVACRALALHHPIDRRGGLDPADATVRAVVAAREAGFTELEQVYVSHLGVAELATVRAGLAAADLSVRVRPRVGTALWLGDPGSYAARSTVVDVHPLERGERYGYRQRQAPSAGSLLVVGGGTAHGIALAAPGAPRGLARVRAVAEATLSASGLALSPFSWAGRKRWFAEPPHMQVSLLFLPASVPAPEVGAELDVDVRMTTTTFDAVVVG